MRAAVDGFIKFGMSPQIDPTVEELFERAGRTHHAPALTSLVPTIAMGGAAATGIAATAQRFEDGSWLIVYDVGLEAVLWYTAQLLALIVGDSGAASNLDPVAAARAIRLSVAVAALGFDANDLPMLRIGDERLIVAGELLTEMELFVLAHELGHVLDGRDPLEVAKEGLHDWHASEKRADEIGLDLMLGDLTEGRAAQPDRDVRFAAVCMLMSVIAAYERGVFAVQPRSHPLASDRWRLLEVRLRDSCGPQLGPLAAAAAAFATAIDVMDRAHPDMERDAEIVRTALAAYVVPTVATEPSVLDGVAKGYLLLNPPLARLIAAAARHLGNPHGFSVPADVLELAAELRHRRDAGIAVTRLHLSEIADRSATMPALPSWMRSALASWIATEDVTGGVEPVEG